MLASWTLIQRYDKKFISFQERETNWNFTGWQVPHFMIVLIPYINLCINTIYQFIKPFLDNKMSIFEEYGAFKWAWYILRGRNSLKTVLSLFRKGTTLKEKKKKKSTPSFLFFCNRSFFRTGLLCLKAYRKLQTLFPLLTKRWKM